MTKRDRPHRPPVVRLIFDLVPDGTDDTIWFVARRQLGWAELQDCFTDFARMPVAVRVEAEWMDVMSGMLGSALLEANPSQLPLAINRPYGEDRVGEENASEE